MKYRLTFAVVVSVVPALLVASAAWAFFLSDGTGHGSATVGSLGVPTSVAGVASGSDVAVTWSAGAAPAGVGYYVSRTPVPSGASADVCGSPASLLASTPTSCTDHAVRAGTYTYVVTAVFHTWATASTPSADVVVARQASSTTLLLSSPTATYGAEQAVTATAVVGTGAGIDPTGTVTVVSGGTTVCTITLPSTTCLAAATALGASGTAHGVTATYAGDGEYVGSESDPQDLTVAQDSTTTTVAAAPTSVTVGYEDTTTLTASVGTGHGEPLPGSEPATIDVGEASCVATLVPAGDGATGSCHIGASDLAVSGSRYGITTAYVGDADLAGSPATAPTGLLVVTTPTVTTASLPDATRTQTGYDQPLSVVGGSTPFTWSISAGTLPTGLVLDPATGHVTGDVGALADTATVTVRAVDGSGAAAEATYTLTVHAAPHITTASLAGAWAGEAGYDQTLVATGGTPDLSWSTGDILPGGLALDPATGVISGNVHNGVLSATFSVTVTDANGVTDTTSLTITVTPVFVQQVTIPRAAGSHTTFTAVLPNPVATGRTLVLSLAQPCTDAGNPVTSDVLDASWNGLPFTRAAGSGCTADGDAELWYLTGTVSASGAAATTVTVDLSAPATVPYLNVTEYTGVTGVDVGSGPSSSAVGTGASVSPGSVTPASAGELVVTTAFVNRATAGTLAAQLDPFQLLNRTTPFLGFGAFLVDPATASLGWTYEQTAPAAWAAVSCAFTLAP